MCLCIIHFTFCHYFYKKMTKEKNTAMVAMYHEKNTRVEEHGFLSPVLAINQLFEPI